VIPLKEQDVLKQRFARELQSRVRVDFFGQKPHGVFVPGRVDNSAVCEDVRKLLHELAALNLRISLTDHDIDDDSASAEALGVQRVPAIVLRGQTNRPVRYFGNPRMRQFIGFVEALSLVANGKPTLEAETAKTLRRLRSDVSVKVFVTPGCAHSPLAVLTALRLALESAHVKLDVYDVTTFPELITPFFVRVTPMTVFNDQYAIPGIIEEGNLAQDIQMTAQGTEPSKGGDAKRLTPLTPPQPRRRQPAGPRTSPGGLYIPR
jgi:alkyl hydroperoxide reductase subunit AhpF